MGGYSYELQKGDWIIFNDGRKKMKLRKFIRDAALEYYKAGYGTFIENRRALIIAWNKDGTEGVKVLHEKIMLEIDKDG